MSDRIYVVTTADFAGIPATRSLLAVLSQLGYSSSKVQLIHNRASAARDVPVTDRNKLFEGTTAATIADEPRGFEFAPSRAALTRSRACGYDAARIADPLGLMDKLKPLLRGSFMKTVAPQAAEAASAARSPTGVPLVDCAGRVQRVGSDVLSIRQ